jgi:hypothetical protein
VHLFGIGRLIKSVLALVIIFMVGCASNNTPPAITEPVASKESEPIRTNSTLEVTQDKVSASPDFKASGAKKRRNGGLDFDVSIKKIVVKMATDSKAVILDLSPD